MAVMWSLKKYFSFFRMRFLMGLQYRVAALAGMVTQFVWGAMEIMLYSAFYRADAQSFPMTFEAMAAYIWFQQAFLALFASWMYEDEIFASIVNGNIAYELCKPVKIYEMWFIRGLALRMSRAVLRSVPILFVALLLPKPYGLPAPKNAMFFCVFCITLLMGLLVVVSFCTFIYVLTFFTISPQGIKVITVSLMDFLTGAVIPLPFFPDSIRKILEILPFAAMQNVPLRVYSGNIAGVYLVKAFTLQIFWLVVFVLLGKLLLRIAQRKITLLGG